MPSCAHVPAQLAERQGPGHTRIPVDMPVIPSHELAHDASVSGDIGLEACLAKARIQALRTKRAEASENTERAHARATADILGAWR